MRVFWLKISSEIFWFCNNNFTIFQNLENVKISIFPFTLSRQKCGYCPGRKAISSNYFTFFKNILFERWVLFENVHRDFMFCNSNVTTFPKSRKCKNFNFSLYTVRAEMLYLQKYLTNFQKHFFGWKMRKVAIGVENFLFTDIWFCNSNVTTFQNPENVKISIFPFKLSREKCCIFKSIFYEFSKTSLFAEIREMWLLCLKISCALRYLVWQ